MDTATTFAMDSSADRHLLHWTSDHDDAPPSSVATTTTTATYSNTTTTPATTYSSNLTSSINSLPNDVLVVILSMAMFISRGMRPPTPATSSPRSSAASDIFSICKHWHSLSTRVLCALTDNFMKSAVITDFSLPSPDDTVQRSLAASLLRHRGVLPLTDTTTASFPKNSYYCMLISRLPERRSQCDDGVRLPAGEGLAPTRAAKCEMLLTLEGVGGALPLPRDIIAPLRKLISIDVRRMDSFTSAQKTFFDVLDVCFAEKNSSQKNPPPPPPASSCYIAFTLQTLQSGDYGCGVHFMTSPWMKHTNVFRVDGFIRVVAWLEVKALFGTSRTTSSYIATLKQYTARCAAVCDAHRVHLPSTMGLMWMRLQRQQWQQRQDEQKLQRLHNQRKRGLSLSTDDENATEENDSFVSQPLPSELVKLLDPRVCHVTVISAHRQRVEITRHLPGGQKEEDEDEKKKRMRKEEAEEE